jgi:hypothetical protein
MTRRRGTGRVCEHVGCANTFRVGHASGVDQAERFCTEHRSMVCPRRSEGIPGALSNYPQTDEWRQDGSYRTCSYCGSLHPDDFMQLVRDGAEVGPTDKSYKAYIELPEGKSVRGAPFYYHHLAADQQQEFVDLANAGKMTIGYPGRFYSGVYLPALMKDGR